MASSLPVAETPNALVTHQQSIREMIEDAQTDAQIVATLFRRGVRTSDALDGFLGTEPSLFSFLQICAPCYYLPEPQAAGLAETYCVQVAVGHPLDSWQQ